jgi:hypothetical protein
MKMRTFALLLLGGTAATAGWALSVEKPATPVAVPHLGPGELGHLNAPKGLVSIRGEGLALVSTCEDPEGFRRLSKGATFGGLPEEGGSGCVPTSGTFKVIDLDTPKGAALVCWPGNRGRGWVLIGSMESGPDPKEPARAEDFQCS